MEGMTVDDGRTRTPQVAVTSNASRHSQSGPIQETLAVPPRSIAGASRGYTATCFLGKTGTLLSGTEFPVEDSKVSLSLLLLIVLILRSMQNATDIPLEQ